MTDTKLILRDLLQEIEAAKLEWDDPVESPSYIDGNNTALRHVERLIKIHLGGGITYV